jgi:hypothetical protein
VIPLQATFSINKTEARAAKRGELNVSTLTLFGVLAVAAMLIFYALEDRAPSFVLLFAGACAASSVYGFLQGAWPFGVVEGVWTVVAVDRWRGRTAVSGGATHGPIACDMSALTTDERRRYDALRARIVDAITHVVSTPTSFRLQIADTVPLTDVAEWVRFEHRCCPFLNIDISVQSDDRIWVELGGSAAIKEFLRAEFATVV